MSKLISMTAAMTCLAITASAGNDTPHWSLTWKKMQTTGPELELIGTLPTRTTHELGASDWSVGCETLDRDYADFDSYKPYLSELGVTSARIQSGWARCEQKKGKYEFGWLDEAVDGLCEQGIRPWMCLACGNPVYGAQKSLGSRIFTDEERHFKALRLGVLAEATVHEASVRLALEHSFNNRLEAVKLHKL